MWNAFRLTIEEPAVVRRVGMMDGVLDVADKLEDEIQFEDGSYLLMTAHYMNDSLYCRLRNFWFPVYMVIHRQQGEGSKKTTVSRCDITLWKREEDSRCLVMLNSVNTKENNFEGPYEEALGWILTMVRGCLS